jgi:hypothetical protein
MSISAPAAALVVLIGLAFAQAPALAFAQAHATAGPRVARHASTDARAGVSMWGFEPLADGSTRLFVELTKPVTYESKVARGSITYVLKGARVMRRNNTNPIVTVHFNTPVTSARLVPHGHDLWFVIDLRADVQPAVSMDAGKDGRAVMKIALPKGAYLPAGADAPPAVPADDAPPGSPEQPSTP